MDLSTHQLVYAAGDQVRPDDLAGRLGYVERGLLAVVRRDSRDRRGIVDLLGACNTLGESSLVGRRPSSDAPALHVLVPTRIRWLDSTTATVEDPSSLARALMAVLAARIRHQQELACRRRTQSVSQRTAGQLVDLREEKAADDTSVLDHLSRTTLARILGHNRAMVSGICAEFERRGWCARLGAPGAVLDIPALAAHADLDLSDLPGRPSTRLRDHQDALWHLALELTARRRHALVPVA